MADIICRWRNGTPKTVVELVNSMPHYVMPNAEFREFMGSKWDGKFFRTPYQLACQLGLYYESDDGFYYPRFDHDITEEEALRYLEHWLPRYYIPNPYVGKSGFLTFDCPTYLLELFVNYSEEHNDCDFSQVMTDLFGDDGINNADIIGNYIDKYSKSLRIDRGKLIKVKDNFVDIYIKMDRHDKKSFFQNFNQDTVKKLIEDYKSLPIEERQKMFYQFMRTSGLAESSCSQYAFQHPKQDGVMEVVKIVAGKDSLFDVFDKAQVSEIHKNVIPLDGNKNQGNSWSGSIFNYQKFLDYLNVGTSTNSNTILSGQPLQQISYGAPGTGKSHTVNEITEKMPDENVFRITFHPDSDYSTFVGCYKPTKETVKLRDVTGKVIKETVDGAEVEVTEDRITYKFVPQSFIKAYVKAMQTPEENVMLVIEEINRGNCAQIFGDMFQLLDRNVKGLSDYAVKPDTDLEACLKAELGDKYNENEGMRLPKNLYIWATMNTSDQSLFPIDSAFKRRWEWKYMPIKDCGEGYKIVLGNGKEYDWYEFISKMNELIANKTTSEDKQMGYFFIKAEGGKISADRFVNKVLFYLYNDVFKSYDLPTEFGNKKFTDFFDNMDTKVEELLDKLLDKKKTAASSDEGTAPGEEE